MNLAQTHWPGKSRKKNITACLYRDLRVGTSASYNGKDFSRILPSLKNNSLFKQPKKLQITKNHLKFPEMRNLIDSRFSCFVNEKNGLIYSNRGQSHHQKKPALQESRIFRHVKFPSARFFYTEKSNKNLCTEDNSKGETFENIINGGSQYDYEQNKATLFTSNNLLSKERKRKYHVKSEIMTTIYNDRGFI